MRTVAASLGIAALLLGGGALAGLAACSGEESAPAPAPPPPPEDLIAPGPHDVAVLDMGDLGEIRIELLPELAPRTVAHFEALAREGVYDDTYFHRVIPGFMIQGGDPNTRDNDPRNDGIGGEGNPPDELSRHPFVRGTVAMANRGRPNSADSQFFIVHQDQPDLPASYTIFGRVVQGMDVVDAITELEIDKYGRYGPPDRPYPVSAVVEGVAIERADGSEPRPAGG